MRGDVAGDVRVRLTRYDTAVAFAAEQLSVCSRTHYGILTQALNKHDDPMSVAQSTKVISPVVASCWQ